MHSTEPQDTQGSYPIKYFRPIGYFNVSLGNATELNPIKHYGVVAYCTVPQENSGESKPHEIPQVS